MQKVNSGVTQKTNIFQFYLSRDSRDYYNTVITSNIKDLEQTREKQTNVVIPPVKKHRLFFFAS